MYTLPAADPHPQVLPPGQHRSCSACAGPHSRPAPRQPHLSACFSDPPALALLNYLLSATHFLLFPACVLGLRCSLCLECLSQFRPPDKLFSRVLS